MESDSYETIGSKILDLLKGQNTAFAKTILNGVLNAIDSKSTLE